VSVSLLDFNKIIVDDHVANFLIENGIPFNSNGDLFPWLARKIGGDLVRPVRLWIATTRDGMIDFNYLQQIGQPLAPTRVPMGK
ncbi:hypothetical protein ACJX0J_006986, partial [Zea mays]